MTNSPDNWIYILLTSADYSRCKIGFSSNNPLERYRTLRTADPYLGLLVAYHIPKSLGSATRLEADIHYEFKDYRINTHDEGASEWFRIPAAQAELCIDDLLEVWLGQKVYYFGTYYPGKLLKMYESEIKDLFEPSQCGF